MVHQEGKIYGTTILTVALNNQVVVIGDGQMTLGNTVMKHTAKKVRKLDGDIALGFAGSVADSLTLAERLEEKIRAYPGQLLKACVELAKAWRTDKYLRKLESMMIVANKQDTFVLTGSGEVIQPENRIAAIGSGGNYALAAALALVDVPGVEAVDIAKKAMNIAANMCIYTNDNFTIEVIK